MELRRELRGLTLLYVVFALFGVFVGSQCVTEKDASSVAGDAR